MAAVPTLIITTDNVLDPLVFDDLTPIEVPVRIKGKDYVLREATEDIAIKYRNASLKSARLKDGVISGMDGIADADAILVAGCLFEVRDRTRAPGSAEGLGFVSVAWVRDQLHKVIKPLVDRAKKISELEELPDTVDALDKEIAKLQRRRAALLGESEVEVSAPKGDSPSTPATSS